MSIPKQHEREFAQFPKVLSELVMAELASGNTIAEFSHGFPAAPCGAYIKLTKPVSTRPRVKTPELDFYDRNANSYSGEYTDAMRHFFVLEPPHPPSPPPDMDAIRAKINALEAHSNNARERPAERVTWEEAHPDPKSVVGRFKASMEIDYEKWHDGIGYDLDLIKQANPKEQKAIEDLLIQRRNGDWRDVEALAALDSPRAKEALKTAMRTGNAQVRMAVHASAPELVTEPQRIASLVQALEQADNYSGLTQALLEVETFHPPEIIRVLLRGLMERDGGTACHLAGMLYFLHGKSAMAFDWNHRPFFLRFNTDDLAEREKAVRELCETIRVDPSRCIKPKPAKPIKTPKKLRTARQPEP